MRAFFFASVLVVTSACTQAPSSSPATNLPLSMPLAPDQIALTFNRCEREEGALQCLSVRENDGASVADWSTKLIYCLAKLSEGRVVYIGDATIHDGLWLDLSGSFQADAASRFEMEAVLYKEHGVYISGYRFSLPSKDWAVDRLCEGLMANIITPAPTAN